MILYPASYVKGIVSIKDGLIPKVVPDCEILGAGTALKADGIVVADQDRFWFIPLFTPDFNTICDKLTDICDKMKLITSALNNASTLLDSSTQVIGQASMVPSTVKGAAISQQASQAAGQIDTLKTAISQFKSMLT